jgi:hypothetical protein
VQNSDCCRKRNNNQTGTTERKKEEGGRAKDRHLKWVLCNNKVAW